MRDFNMTLMQKTEMKRHFNFKLEFNSVSLLFSPIQDTRHVLLDGRRDVLIGLSVSMN